MSSSPRPSWVAFVADQRIARGAPASVALAVQRYEQQQRTPAAGLPALILDESTGRQIDLDTRGTPAEVKRRYAADGAADPTPARRRGRPKLGVVGREVTLLPRHWAWLDGQRGGASATLRRLVDRARKESVDSDRRREAQDRTHRLMTLLAGDRVGFEEACRALYAADGAGFLARTREWPDPVREVIEDSAADAFPRETRSTTEADDGQF